MDKQVLDQDAVNLAKAIRQHESGGDFNAQGKSGETGAYQFTAPTWKGYAKEVLGDENAPMTPENQNKVAYTKIKKWKDEGKNIGQIASMWNAGEEKPNAYLEGNVGVNKYGVHYDTPTYAKKVAEIYQQMKTQTPETITEEPKKDGFLKSLAKGIISPVATILARPIQAGAELLGASAEEVNKATQNIAGDWVAPVPQSATDVIKDIGRAVQTVALGMPASTIPKAIGMGAVAGAGAGLEEKGTLGGAVSSSVLGAGTGFVGGGISKVLEKLPIRLIQDAFKGLKPEQAERMLATKTLGKTSNILEQSNKAIKNYGGKLDSALNKDAYKNIVVNAENVLSNLADNPEARQKLIDTGLNLDQIGSKIKKIIPLKANLVDKFFNEGLSVPELHRLNSALGEATFKTTLFDAPTVKAGKELGSIIYHGTGDYIKGIAKETVPLFDELSKEYALRKAIGSVAKKTTGGLIRWGDIVPFMAGSGVAGLPGGLVGVALSRVAQSPATEFATAKTISKLGKATKPVISRAGLLPTLLKEKSKKPK